MTRATNRDVLDAWARRKAERARKHCAETESGKAEGPRPCQLVRGHTGPCQHHDGKALIRWVTLRRKEKP